MPPIDLSTHYITAEGSCSGKHYFKNSHQECCCGNQGPWCSIICQDWYATLF